jgi:hypothetical protein
MAQYDGGIQRVSLDQTIETMRQTGMDMHAKYQERRSAGWRSTYRSVEGSDPRDGRARGGSPPAHGVGWPRFSRRRTSEPTVGGVIALIA